MSVARTLSLLALGLATKFAQPAPSLTAATELTPQGVKVVVTGTDWPPRVAVTLSVSPSRAPSTPISLGTVQSTSSGALRATRLVPCTATASIGDDARAIVTARSADGAVVRDYPMSAAAWRCPPR